MNKFFALCRPLACVLLVMALFTQQYLESTPLLSLRQTLFDSYQRWHPRDRSEIPVIVVEIDEKSLAQEGQWPWPRQRIADLIQAIHAGNPLMVGLDMVFSEPDQLGREALRKRYPGNPLLDALPDPDTELAKAIKEKKLVLGQFGVDSTTVGGKASIKSPVLQVQGSQENLRWVHYPSRLGNLPSFTHAALGQGLLNATPDGERFGQERGVLRRIPLVAEVQGQPQATLGLEMLRQALGDAPIQIRAQGKSFEQVGSGDYHLPTDASGNLLLHFGPWQKDRYVSASDILSGKAKPEDFKDRFVIVGLTGLGLVDHVLSPLGERIPGVDVHSQVIESLLAQDAVRRPGWVPTLEAFLLLGVGLVLLLSIPRLKPRHTAGLGAALLVILLLVGLLLFRIGHWQFDGLSIAVLLTPLFIILLRDALIVLDQQKAAAEAALHQSREAAAKVAGELGAARRIQLGLLPDPLDLFKKEPRFELAALLEPAREIGGDYYDCFMLDDNRLCISIGDVTGKGVPASLFMAISKTLCGTMTRQTNGDPGASLSAVAAEINRENPHYLFVTTVLAVLDVNTGQITYACGGHEAPIIRRGEETLRLEVKDISGPPLCALRDYAFESTTGQLQPGDLVCLFTDGINEATDGVNFYGTERIVELMAALPTGTSSQACLDAIYQDTEKFMGGHPPADDRTLLVFRWWGPAGQPA